MFLTEPNLIDQWPILRGTGRVLSLCTGIIDTKVTFAKDDKLLARNLVFENRLAYDFFGAAIRVHATIPVKMTA